MLFLSISSSFSRRKLRESLVLSLRLRKLGSPGSSGRQRRSNREEPSSEQMGGDLHAINTHAVIEHTLYSSTVEQKLANNTQRTVHVQLLFIKFVFQQLYSWLHFLPKHSFIFSARLSLLSAMSLSLSSTTSGLLGN